MIMKAMLIITLMSGAEIRTEYDGKNAMNKCVEAKHTVLAQGSGVEAKHTVLAQGSGVEAICVPTNGQKDINAEFNAMLRMLDAMVKSLNAPATANVPPYNGTD
jgi:hypothetical protein